jgi:hypothetical protein
MNTKLKAAIMKAYADCHMDWEKGAKLRNLDFCASEFVSRDEAFKILSEAIPGGYNAFNANLLLAFPKNARFQIAREGSVCLYVTGKNLPSAEKVSADEKDGSKVVRYWWD